MQVSASCETREPHDPYCAGTLVCELSLVLRLQILLRLGVRAVTPLAEDSHPDLDNGWLECATVRV